MKSIAKFSLIFSNVGYVGYPVIKILFGDYMLFIAAIYNVFFRILLYTARIALIKSDKTYEHASTVKMILNPCSFSTFIGVAINILHVNIKDFFIFNGIENFGYFATSASLLLLGFVISNQQLKDVYKNKKIISVCLIKMFIIPIIIGTILIRIFGFQDYILTMIYLIGTPISINLLVFSIKYNQDITHESSIFIVISTILYFVSLPFTSLVLSFVKGIFL